MPLELSPSTMRTMVELATERIVGHIESLPSQPMHAVTGGRKLARSLREPMPETGTTYEKLLRLLFGRVIPASLNSASPGYLAYVPGGGLFHAAVADLITLATNRYVGMWQAAPGLVQLERNVLEWFAAMLGFPTGAGGLLTSGGSIGTLVALVTARDDRLSQEFQRGVIYVSSEVHHAVTKAAHVAGFLRERLRVLPTDSTHRLSIAALEDAIAHDRAQGLDPFCVVGSAGAVNTGIVDDLEGLADVARRERLWFHVDAAYGGFFALTERGRQALRGIELADSVVLDPHKGLFLPYGTGAVLVRDRRALERAHAVRAPYLPPRQDDEGVMDFCDMGPELSRDARGIRIWLPLKMHGAAVFREALDEKLDLAEHAYRELASEPGVEFAQPPTLSLFAWRHRPAGLDPEALDAWNRRLLAGVNRRQRVLLTGTTLERGFYLRFCVLSFRTHRDRIDAALEDIRAELAALRS